MENSDAYPSEIVISSDQLNSERPEFLKTLVIGLKVCRLECKTPSMFNLYLIDALILIALLVVAF